MQTHALSLFGPQSEIPLEHRRACPTKRQSMKLALYLITNITPYHPTMAVQYTSGAAKIKSNRLCIRRRGWNPSEDGGKIKTVNAFSKESHCVVRRAFGARKLDKSTALQLLKCVNTSWNISRRTHDMGDKA
jgi:hypothetical protein